MSADDNIFDTSSTAQTEAPPDTPAPIGLDEARAADLFELPAVDHHADPDPLGDTLRDRDWHRPEDRGRRRRRRTSTFMAGPRTRGALIRQLAIFVFFAVMAFLIASAGSALLHGSATSTAPQSAAARPSQVVATRPLARAARTARRRAQARPAVRAPRRADRHPVTASTRRLPARHAVHRASPPPNASPDSAPSPAYVPAPTVAAAPVIHSAPPAVASPHPVAKAAPSAGSEFSFEG